MRQNALCITYHQDFSSEGSSEQVIEVNNPTGKDLGLLEITSWTLGNDVLLLKGEYPTQIPKQEHSLQDMWNNPLLGTGKASEVPSLWMYGISGNRISRRIVVSQGPSLGSAEERNGHRQDFRKGEMVSFSPEPKRLWWHVTDPWAISRGIAQRRGPRLRAGLEHTLSLELKEPREKPCGLQPASPWGNFLVFCHIDLWAFILWKMPEKVTAEGPFCCDLAMAVPRPHRTTTTHCSVFPCASAMTVHPPAQPVTDKMSSWLEPSKSWQ